MRAAERLYALQQLDDRIERLRAEAASLRRALEGDPAAADRRPLVERLRAERAVLAARMRAAEAEEQSQRARARTHERQLMSGAIHNPKELTKLSEELDHMRSRISVQEEGLFEMLEAQEQLDLRLAEAERQAQADAQALRRAEEDLATGSAGREAIWSGLSEAVRRLYERVAAIRRPAVVEVLGGACGGCRLPIAGTRLKLARGGEPLVCEACNRILYLA